MLKVSTARMGYRGPNWLDVTRKGNDGRIAKGERGGHQGIGAAFAPSRRLLGAYLQVFRDSKDGVLSDRDWLAYRKAFIEEMRASYQRNRPAWDDLLSRDEVVLLCFCNVDPARCHRRILAEDILPKLGAENRGELTPRQIAELEGRDA